MDDLKKSKADLIKELQESRKLSKQYEIELADRKIGDSMLIAMIENSPISIQILDKEGLSVVINKAHTRFFGAVPPPGYKMLEDYFLLKQGLGEYFQRLQQGEAVFFPETWYNANLINPALPDKLVWVKTIGFPLLKEKGKPKGYVVMHEDITERIKLEMELAEQKGNLRFLYKNTQQRIELFRKNIAADFHDNLIQDLAAHKIKLGEIKRGLTDNFLKEELKRELVFVNAMIRKARNILNAIWPTIIDNQGIEAAINTHSDSFSRVTHLVVCRHLQQGMVIPKDISYSLFMIFTEALTNIEKHARAANVWVSLMQENHHLHFTISDDGKGFNENKTHKKMSFGLFMIKDLVQSLGGTITILNAKPHGTIIDIIMPDKIETQ